MSVLLIVFTLLFGREMLIVTLVFAMMEAVVYGFGLWVLMYFYVWPLLVLLVLVLKPIIKTNFILWAVVAGVFGLTFGAMCSLVYLPLGWSFALSYFIAGLPWDLTHSISNFILTLLLGSTLYHSMKTVIKSVR